MYAQSHIICKYKRSDIKRGIRECWNPIFIHFNNFSDCLYEILNRDFTPVIASHNLRELEDICDHVGLLHKGNILVSRDLEDMKINIQKVQCVLDGEKRKELFQELDIMQSEQRGSLLTLTVRGTREEVLRKVEEKEPIFYEILPLTLEEIFISETEVAGYDIKSLLV